jgi:hypothetical protein
LKLAKLRAAYFVVAWVLVLSLLPLVYNLATPHAWVGYGEGNYVFDNGHLHLETAGITYGGSKPLIEAYLANATTGGKVQNGNPQELVEVSDQASYVNGMALFNSSFSTHVMNESTLVTVYTASNLTVTKQVTVRGANVFVTYSSPRPVNYDISFWHWYYGSVNGTTSEQMGGPGCTSGSPARLVTAAFSDVSAAQLHSAGDIAVAVSTPSDVTICRDDTGINKFVVAAQADALAFTISGSIGTAGDVSPVSMAITEIGSALPFQIAFPMAAMVAILVWRKQSRSR